MNKLKTLKDFKMWGTCGCSGQEGLTIEVWRLKQEAIKWIKEFNTEFGNKGNHITPEDIHIMNNKCATILWIKNFFNITEEELEVKDGKI
jgi:hypothetical protein